MWLKNAAVLDSLFHFTPADLRVVGEQIDILCSHGRYRTDSEESLDFSGKYIIPGLIDIHIHGCSGRDVSDGKEGSLEIISGFLAQNGVTSFLPTTVTLEDNALVYALRQIRAFQQGPIIGAYAHGANMEGPYLSKEKRGAHREDWLQNPRIMHFLRMNQECGGQIKILSVAPELEGAMEFIAVAKDSAKISIAHTSADYDTAMKAIQKGVSHATHMYNAMTGLNHRAPGVVGAIADSHITAELICDCVHIHPAVIRTTFGMLGYDRVIMMSDAIAATGLTDGQYRLGGLDVWVKKGQAHLEDGTIAGSTATLMEDVRRAYAIGIPLEKAIRAASYNPAVALGIEERTGSIAEGKWADLVVLNDQLQVEYVLVKGVPVYNMYEQKEEKGE